jgi:tetratricopeptide (TPR) repeat protein
VNNQGLLALKQGDVVTAKAKFDEAIRMSPGFGPAWANVGALALQYRDYPAAAEALSKACAADPARYELQLAHAWSLEGLKKPADARAAYERVLALKPGQDDALYGKAAALRAEGKLPEAMAAFKAYAASDKAPRLKDATAQISQIDLRLKNPPKAAVEVAKREPAKSGAGADISKLELPPGAAGSSEPALNLPTDLPLGLDDQLALPPSVTAVAPAPAATPAQAPSAGAPKAAAPAALPPIPAKPAAAPAAATPAPSPAPKAAPETKPSGTAGPSGGAPDNKAGGETKPATPAAAK